MYEIQLAFEKIEEVSPSKAGESDSFEGLRFCVSQHFVACFDFNFPFRPLLLFIRDCIKQQKNAVELILPAYGEFEDFIDGHITLGDRTIAVYFEHSLACLSFASDKREDLETLVAATTGQSFQHVGYGLKDGQL